jgi:hypothetical protein
MQHRVITLGGLLARSAFWIRVGDKYPNPAVSLDQQYHP